MKRFKTMCFQMLLHALVCLLYVSKSMHTTQSTSLCTVFLHVLWFEFAIRFVCIKEKETFLWFFIFAIGFVIWNECAKSKLKTALHPLNDGYSPHTPERIIWLVSLVFLGGSLLIGLLSFYCRQCRCLKHKSYFYVKCKLLNMQSQFSRSGYWRKKSSYNYW